MDMRVLTNEDVMNMSIEIKYCEQNDSYYAEERTRKYKMHGKELQKIDGQIKKLQRKTERIREHDPDFKEPRELKCLQRRYEALTEERGLEKRVYRINADDLPEGTPVRILYRKPKQIYAPTETEYEDLLTRIRSKAEKRLTANVSAADNEVVSNA